MDAVIERRNISRSLDGGVTAQSHDASSRAADISEKKLQQCAAADDLRAAGVLRPTHSVSPGGRAVATGILKDGAGRFKKSFPGTTRDSFDHCRSVAAEMLLHDLEDRLRMLQAGIERSRILPGRIVITVYRAIIRPFLVDAGQGHQS